MSNHPLLPTSTRHSPKSTRPPNPRSVYTAGYPRIATRMSLLPETAIFRRFSALAARNLLYYQNELSELETELKELERADAASEIGKKKKYVRDAYSLMIATEDRDRDTEKRDLVLRMRRVLREYQ